MAFMVWPSIRLSADVAAMERTSVTRVLVIALVASHVRGWRPGDRRAGSRRLVDPGIADWSQVVGSGRSRAMAKASANMPRVNE